MNEFELLLNATPTGALVILGLTIVIFFGIIVYLAIRLNHSIQQAALNNGRGNQYLAAVPADRIGTVNAVYQNTRKNLSSALILTLVGGIFGLQRAYLGKRKSAMAMFLFFWTGIPSIVSLFDLTDMPRIVSEFNLGVIESLYNQIAAPKLEE
ncbi:MAG: TM2 domain-containing protein [Flexilinea sp.]|nr:TM2 domain-containing protein [Flexilinea sp.]